MYECVNELSFSTVVSSAVNPRSLLTSLFVITLDSVDSNVRGGSIITHASSLSYTNLITAISSISVLSPILFTFESVN